jgi:predicted nucleic acid-binding Zn ribbon protein
MKFEQKYPNAKDFNTVQDRIMKSQNTLHCYVCGEFTRFLEKENDIYVCSDECLDKNKKNLQRKSLINM